MSSSSPSKASRPRFPFSLVLLPLPLPLLLPVLAGCEPPQMNPPLVPQSTAHSTMSCVEIKTSLSDTSERLPPTSAVLWFEFQNQCDTAIRMDFRALKVTGMVSRWKESATDRDDEEEEIIGPVPLNLARPSGVSEARLDARSSGSEAMRFDVRLEDRSPPSPSVASSDDDANDKGDGAKKRRRHRRYDADARLTKVCVDLTSVAELRPGGDNRSAFCIDIPERAHVAHVATKEEASGSPSPNQPYYPYDSGVYRFEDHDFGARWNTINFPKLTLDMGLTVHSVALSDHQFSRGNFKVDGSQIGDRLYAGTLDIRTKGYIHGPFYLGVDFGFGLGGSRRTTLVDRPTGETKSLSPQPSAILTGSVFTGISGRVGFVQPFAEIGAGGQGVLYSLDNPNDTSSSKQNISSWWATITPRGGIDFWFHPNLTLGVYGGVDALHTESWFTGIRFSAHLRALDGR